MKKPTTLNPHQTQAMEELRTGGLSAETIARINIGLQRYAADITGFAPSADPVESMFDSASCVGHAKPFAFKSAAEARAFALAHGNIKLVTLAELDEFLEPFVYLGLLRTEYNRITGATEHRNAVGQLIAMTVGQRHFIHRRQSFTELAASRMQLVHAYLVDPRIGEKIEGSDFTIENKTGEAQEASAEQLGIYNSYRTAKGLPTVTTFRRPW